MEIMEIWGLETQKYPYNGYLPVPLMFGPSAVVKTETFDTLAVVYPCPPGEKQNFLLIETNIYLVNKLKDYLYSADFVVKSNNNSLTYVLTTAKLDATKHRMLAGLSGFRF